MASWVLTGVHLKLRTWIEKKVAVPTLYHQELVLMEMSLMSLHAVRQTNKK